MEDSKLDSIQVADLALKEAEAGGKHSVLMHVKTSDATRFVAVPLAKG